MTPKVRAERGVSLIEALVAMAAMAFGMLGVVGIQSTMRMNADIAKQRSEAVRIAQETVETRRTFSTIATDPLAVRVAYDDIVSNTVGRVVPGTNATFTVFETVTAAPVGVPAKSLAVRVDWTDRLGQPQSVSLTTNIARISPELSGALSIWNAGSPVGGGGGRPGGPAPHDHDLRVAPRHVSARRRARRGRQGPRRWCSLGSRRRWS